MHVSLIKRHGYTFQDLPNGKSLAVERWGQCCDWVVYGPCRKVLGRSGVKENNMALNVTYADMLGV